MKRTAPLLSLSMLSCISLSACGLLAPTQHEESMPEVYVQPLNSPPSDASITTFNADEYLNKQQERMPLSTSAKVIPPLPPQATSDQYDPEDKDTTASTQLEKIQDSGKITFGVSDSLYRLSYIDNETGELVGFEIDLAREIAKDIFGDPDRAEFLFLTQNNVTQSLDSGRVDVAARALSVTPQRQIYTEFTMPYLHTPIRVMKWADSPYGSIDALKGKTVCVTKDSTANGILAKKDYSGFVMEVADWSDCLFALKSDQVQGIVSDEGILGILKAQDINTTYGSVVTDFSDWAMAVHPNPDDPSLVEQINASLSRMMADGTWQRIFSHWLAPYVSGYTTQPSTSFRTPEQSIELDKRRQHVKEEIG